MKFALRAWLAALAAAGCMNAALHAVPRADVRQAAEPMNVYQLMLWLADIDAGDVLYDLGCRDARLVIAAVLRFGAWAVCVDADPARIAAGRAQAQRAGVADRVRFLNQDILAARVDEAKAVVLMLPRALALGLRPKLERELRPGARVVSHGADLGDWKPDVTAYARSGGVERPVYLWSIAPR